MAWDDDVIGGMKLEDRLGFGKWRGKTVEEVCEVAPDYLEWAQEHGVVTLSKEAKAHWEACLKDYESERLGSDEFDPW